MLTSELTIQIESLNLGELYYKICNFDLAIEAFEKSLQNFENKKEWENWTKALSFLIRIRAERLDHTELKRLIEISKNSSPPDLKFSSLQYVAGIAETYSGNLNSALAFFNEALTLQKNPRERLQALLGIAAVESQRGAFENCLLQLNEIETAICSYEHSEQIGQQLNDFKISFLLLKAICFRELNQIQQAENFLNQAEEICHIQKNTYMVLNCLFQKGALAQRQSDYRLAQHYFNLCRALIREKDLRHLAKQIQERLNQIESEMQKEHPRVSLQKIDSKIHIVINEKGQTTLIDGSRQFLLIRLLEFFGESPGHIKSKEQIVQHLWGEDYHPLRHDNKVYVTIKRLRSLLNDLCSSRLLLKNSDGYFFNPKYIFQCQTERIPA